MHRMDIKQMRYFVEICKCRSFSMAADKLFISQQGLSMAILRLESELNCKLFKRTSRGLTLTEHGEYLLPKATEILRLFDLCEEHFEQNLTKSGTVKIGCAFGAMPEIAGDLIFSFQQEYPQFKPEVYECTDVMCDQALENETVEIAFGLWPLNQKKFVSHLLFSQPICLLVHKTHPWAREESATVGMLRSQPIMVMDENSKTNAIVKEACRREGFEPSIFYLAAEVIAIHRLVNSNRGVGVSVLSVAESLQQPDVRAIPFREQDLRWEVYLMKKRGVTLSTGAQAFERYVLRKTRKNQQGGTELTSV